MSYASSAGIARTVPGYGTTCRKDVLRRVEVPVVPGAAGRAGPAPRREAQPGDQVPARRARLRAGMPAVDHDQAPPVAFALVGELAAELAPAAVRDGLCELAVADHVPDDKILDHDHVVVAGQAGAGTVQDDANRTV